MEYIKKAQVSFDGVLKKPYATEIIAAALVVYSVVAAHLSPKVLEVANSWITRTVALVVLVGLGTSHPLLSVLLVVALVISAQVARRTAVTADITIPPMTAGEPELVMTQNNMVARDSLVARQLEGTQREVVPDPVPGMGCPSCKDVDFVPKEDQTNQVPGADQKSCVQTYQDQYCIQGIESGEVQGYDCKDLYSPF